MAGTTVVAVRRWLVDQLRAHGDLEGVRVYYSYPGEDDAQARAIWTSPASAEVSMPTFRANRQRREERIVVPVTLRVLAHGKDQDAADDEAVEFLATVEQWLAATDVVQAVGALGADQQVLSMQLIGWQQLGFPLPEGGHGAGFELSVRVVARSL